MASFNLQPVELNEMNACLPQVCAIVVHHLVCYERTTKEDEDGLVKLVPLVLIVLFFFLFCSQLSSGSGRALMSESSGIVKHNEDSCTTMSLAIGFTSTTRINPWWPRPTRFIEYC